MFTIITYTKSCIESQFCPQGLNDTASAGIGDLASMRRASLKKSDQLFENIELREYDKEADQKRQNIKSFRIPKKGAAAEDERGDNKAVTVAVNNILKDLDGVAGVHIAQENLPMLEEEEEEELEVTEIEMVVMEWSRTHFLKTNVNVIGAFTFDEVVYFPLHIVQNNNILRVVFPAWRQALLVFDSAWKSD